MELISQSVKRIMEGCKERARDAGLCFEDETLEYIVTNRDLLELSPKLMIPTLYDYWVHDVEVLRGKGQYELYPNNPFETVINTRPAISFYNDNNPDWLNVMIFYHVLGHIDFFQNNAYFRNTWDYDFAGQALADKRLIAKLRSEKGRWVDYIIEFSRGLDNIVGYHSELAKFDEPEQQQHSRALNYYFDIFLQEYKKVSTSEYIKELDRYNETVQDNDSGGEEGFFSEIYAQYPEFESLMEKHYRDHKSKHYDLLQFILANSEMLKKEENAWMRSIIEIVRNTSLFFQPQIRTKIMNEGWASYWHEKLFLADDRIGGHEVDFARVHSAVASLPRVGLNPYALGMRLFQYIEDLGNKGKYSIPFQQVLDTQARQKYDTGANAGRKLIFDIRKQCSDFLFVDFFVEQEFIDMHKLFVTGRRLNAERMVWEYYVKSKDAGQYKQMIFNSMYHPPHIEIDAGKTKNDTLFLNHHFEGKPLVTEYIENTMLGIEYLWGAPVKLETSEVVSVSPGGKSVGGQIPPVERPDDEPKITWRRVEYTMKNRKLSKKEL
ncbi:MAG: SpoVR family protein [Chitinivibrionales bacterium]|nr:SpoVR family protein [Chitinivibrionales bacterium]